MQLESCTEMGRNPPQRFRARWTIGQCFSPALYLAILSGNVNAQTRGIRLSETPLFTIGVSADDPRYQLDRVSAAVWLPGGGLAIANGGDELRYYDAWGRHRVTAGRSGEGPGEFRMVTWLGVTTESTVVAYDARLRRVSSFDRNGKFLGIIPLNRTDLGVGPQVAGLLSDGSFLVLWIIPTVAPPGGGLSQSRVRLVLHSATSDSVRLIGEGPWTEAYFRFVPGRGSSIRRAPFSPTPRYAARGGRIYETNGSTFTVRIRNFRGEQVGVVGDPRRRIALTEEIKRSFLRDTLAFWPQSDRARVEQEFRLMMLHEHLPQVADMRVDAEGFVWLRGRTERGSASQWEVFSPTGLTGWKVDAPPHRTILDVADRFVVLLHSGEYGEDLVSVYGLERSRD